MNTKKNKKGTDTSRYVIFSTYFEDPETGERVEGVDIVVSMDDPFYENLKNEPFVFNERPFDEEPGVHLHVDLDELDKGFKKPTPTLDFENSEIGKNDRENKFEKL